MADPTSVEFRYAPIPPSTSPSWLVGEFSVLKNRPRNSGPISTGPDRLLPQLTASALLTTTVKDTSVIALGTGELRPNIDPLAPLSSVVVEYVVSERCRRRSSSFSGVAVSSRTLSRAFEAKKSFSHLKGSRGWKLKF